MYVEFRRLRLEKLEKLISALVGKIVLGVKVIEVVSLVKNKITEHKHQNELVFNKFSINEIQPDFSIKYI